MGTLHFSLQHKKLKYIHLNSVCFAYCWGVGGALSFWSWCLLDPTWPGIQEGTEWADNWPFPLALPSPLPGRETRSLVGEPGEGLGRCGPSSLDSLSGQPALKMGGSSSTPRYRRRQGCWVGVRQRPLAAGWAGSCYAHSSASGTPRAA